MNSYFIEDENIHNKLTGIFVAVVLIFVFMCTGIWTIIQLNDLNSKKLTTINQLLKINQNLQTELFTRNGNAIPAEYKNKIRYLEDSYFRVTNELMDSKRRLIKCQEMKKEK